MLIIHLEVFFLIALVAYAAYMITRYIIILPTRIIFSHHRADIAASFATILSSVVIVTTTSSLLMQITQDNAAISQTILTFFTMLFLYVLYFAQSGTAYRTASKFPPQQALKIRKDAHLLHQLSFLTPGLFLLVISLSPIAQLPIVEPFSLLLVDFSETYLGKFVAYTFGFFASVFVVLVIYSQLRIIFRFDVQK